MPAPPLHRALAPATLALIIPLGLLGAFIGIQQVLVLGTAGHSGILGLLVAMALGTFLRNYRSAQQQNLAQAATLAATFAAGNALLLPVGLSAAIGRPDLATPLFAGAGLALAVDALLAWRLFGTRAFPAGAPWPQGLAVAETIRAGQEGEHRGVALLLGFLAGAVLAMYRVPGLAFGLAFLARPWLVGTFALGLLLRGHLGDLPSGWLPLPGSDLVRAQVPQGMMLGAAVAALGQLAARARRDHALAATLGMAVAAHVAIACLLALAGGLFEGLAPGKLALFVAYAGLAALVHLLVCGLAAMHTGWFPGLAVAMIALSIGLALGFTGTAMCMAVGFIAATGPGFVAICHGFKAGVLLSHGRSVRRQLLFAALIAFVIAAALVWWLHEDLFAARRIPPMDHVYAIAIRAGAVPGTLGQMALWAIPGALLQLMGGPGRQIGLLFATGLLLLNPAAGWAILAGLVCRALYLRVTSGQGQAEMRSFAAGIIAGDALHGLYDSAWKVLSRR